MPSGKSAAQASAFPPARSRRGSPAPAAAVSRPSRKPVPPPSSPVPPLFLGIEGGGTHTTALLTDSRDRVLFEGSFPPGNLKLLSDRELQWRFREITARLPFPVGALASVAIGLAGTRTEPDRDRIRQAAARVFPQIPCHATNDLETALHAAPGKPGMAARVLVLSGTGSCCFGSTPDGRTSRVGGRGHIIGDRGSATDIGLKALRALVAQADRSGRWPRLGTLILDALALNVPDDLIDWSIQAGKTELAGLAVQVVRAAEQRDPLARSILSEAAEALATDAAACAAHLAPGQPVQFILNGSMLLKNPRFAKETAVLLRQKHPGAAVESLTRPSVWGAAVLAKTLPPSASSSRPLPAPPPPSPIAPLTALLASPTEQRNPRSLKLGTMPLAKAVQLMLDEESQVPAALSKERAALVRVIESVIRAFTGGGHLFYIGAGTSGRLGVLDASECPPTFRAPREQVQGIIAGGQRALWSAVEGAEDDAVAGAEAIRFRNVKAPDVVIGIAASGRTPYVWGALAEARTRGAVTVILCFNPTVKKVLKAHPDAFQPDHVIAPDLGPEVLTGSTRLKAGTATKQVLNLITTLAMTRTGKVISNLMIDLNPSNVKLRDRAERIVTELTGASRSEARAALESSGWIVKEAYHLLSPDAP